MDDAETRLRDTLDSIAQSVSPSPDAYAKARSEWQRRDRRRRLIMLVLAVLIVAVADIVGLWALHSLAQPDPPPRHERIDVIVQP
ncbi:hypothetical protein AQ490_00030 [Wenjunlia vitaminophila]|uniref:Uncharacterized protein n=1 Tax=Wenjunlia vitaminophila TaxID=76728 RepID=A0A0T6LZN6_WENVI|nr:hypothetical protein AQ490_00030 [Wenjunlia vitaminophila]